MATKFCTQCGKSLDSAASFCRFCGAPLGNASGGAGAPVMTASSGTPGSGPSANPAPSDPYYGNGAAASGGYGSAAGSYTPGPAAPARTASGNTNTIALIRKLAVLTVLLGAFICYLLPWIGVKSTYKPYFRMAINEALAEIESSDIAGEFMDEYGFSYGSAKSDMKFVLRSIRDGGLSPVEEAVDYSIFSKMIGKMKRAARQMSSYFGGYSSSEMAEINAASGMFTFLAVLSWVALAAAAAMLALAVLGVLKNRKKMLLGFMIVTSVLFIVHIIINAVMNAAMAEGMGGLASEFGLGGLSMRGVGNLLTLKAAAFFALFLSIGAFVMNIVWKVPEARPVSASPVYPGPSGYSYDAVSPVNPYGPAGTAADPYSAVNTPVNPYNTSDATYNPYAASDTPANPYGSAETPASPNGTAASPVNPYGYSETPAAPYPYAENPAAGYAEDAATTVLSPNGAAPGAGTSSGALHLGNLSGSDGYVPAGSGSYNSYAHESPENMSQAGDL